MPRYRHVIDEDAATALLASEDAQGRPVANRIAGKYLIGYWVGHETRTLYILRIDPLDLDA